jgi:hypothetical protein
MQVKIRVKAAGLGENINHNEMLVRATPRQRPRALSSAGRERRR